MKSSPAEALIGLRVEMTVPDVTLGATSSQFGLGGDWSSTSPDSFTLGGAPSRGDWTVHQPGIPDPPGPGLLHTVMQVGWVRGSPGPPSAPCVTHDGLNVQSPAGAMYALYVFGGAFACTRPMQVIDSALGPAYPISWEIVAEGSKSAAGGGCGVATITGPPPSNTPATYVLTMLLTDGSAKFGDTASCVDGKIKFSASTSPGQARSPNETVPSQWKNCAAVNKRYPHGIGRAGAHDKTTGTPVTDFKRSTKLYKQAIKANSRLDGDRDGIVCEKR